MRNIIEESRYVTIIDDSDIDVFLMEQLIKEMNYPGRLTSYPSALIALQNFPKEGIPDLIFLDINMPNMNGFEFLEAFSKLPEKEILNTKIVMITSSDDPEDKANAFRFQNVIKFITKPVFLKHLKEASNN